MSVTGHFYLYLFHLITELPDRPNAVVLIEQAKLTNAEAEQYFNFI